MSKDLDILNKKHEYSYLGTHIPLTSIMLYDCYEVVYRDEYVTIVKDKERHDVLIYHTLKNYGVHIKYTPPVTIYNKGTVVLYANEYDETLKLGSYVKNIDYYKHRVTNGIEVLDVSFCILYKGNEEYLGKPFHMDIMKRKNDTDDKPLIY